MSRRKKLIWFESERLVVGAEQARVRGERDDLAHGRGLGSPYYGPVTIPWSTDRDGSPAAVGG